jgi:hypothetical protein
MNIIYAKAHMPSLVENPRLVAYLLYLVVIMIALQDLSCHQLAILSVFAEQDDLGVDRHLEMPSRVDTAMEDKTIDILAWSTREEYLLID